VFNNDAYSQLRCTVSDIVSSFSRLRTVETGRVGFLHSELLRHPSSVYIVVYNFAGDHYQIVLLLSV